MTTRMPNWKTPQGATCARTWRSRSRSTSRLARSSINPNLLTAARRRRLATL